MDFPYIERGSLQLNSDLSFIGYAVGESIRSMHLGGWRFSRGRRIIVQRWGTRSIL